MDITVTYKNGKWTTDPNPAIVAVGTKVRWILRAPELENRILVWKVSFHGRWSFGQEDSILKARTQATDRRKRVKIDMEVLELLNLTEDVALTHRGATEAQSADLTGEFKYDLSVEDGETGEQIGEDDPWLVVVRGVMRPFDIYVY